MSKRISVLVGAYGSGKTEIAVNWVQELANQHHRVAIVDLDIMKPFFRSREHRARLVTNNIQVLPPDTAIAQADLPAVPAEVYSVLQSDDTRVVMDVGGDDAGARALGRFNRCFTPDNHEVLLVINTYRPFTKKANDILALAERIEARSRLKITGIISNTNLGSESSLEDVLTGYSVAMEVANQMGVPLSYVAVRNDLEQAVRQELPQAPLLIIKRHMLPPWEDNI